MRDADLTITGRARIGDEAATPRSLAHAARARPSDRRRGRRRCAANRERGRVLDQLAPKPAPSARRRPVPHLAARAPPVPLLAQGGRAGGYVLDRRPRQRTPLGRLRPSLGRAPPRCACSRACCTTKRARCGVRVQLLALDMAGAHRRQREHACAQWPSALGVGRRALALLDRTTAQPPTRSCTARACCDDAITSRSDGRRRCARRTLPCGRAPPARRALAIDDTDATLHPLSSKEDRS